MENDKKPENEVQYLPIFMSIGLSVGMAIGAAMDSISVGMCIGLAIGVGIGSILDARNRKKPEDSTETKTE